MNQNRVIYFFITALVLSFFSSCISSSKIRIFTELKDKTTNDITKKAQEDLIKPSDILQITIFISQDKETERLLNNTTVPAIGSNSTVATGYLVDDSGYVKFPLLGKVLCRDLSKKQLEDKIAKLLTDGKVAIDPIVSVRISNYKITLLGEVTRPGVFNVQNEKITIIEAIGMAGDLTVFAQRDNVLLIREQNGKRTYTRFSLNDPDIFNKDCYYLQNQDVIYFEPHKSKSAAIDRSSQFVSMGISTITLLLLLYSNLLGN
jgi:polysaccharide export outer membrane protein